MDRSECAVSLPWIRIEENILDTLNDRRKVARRECCDPWSCVNGVLLANEAPCRRRTCFASRNRDRRLLKRSKGNVQPIFFHRVLYHLQLVSFNLHYFHYDRRSIIFCRENFESQFTVIDDRSIAEKRLFWKIQQKCFRSFQLRCRTTGCAFLKVIVSRRGSFGLIGPL